MTAKQRLKAAKANRAEIKRLRRTGELVPISEANKILQGAIDHLEKDFYDLFREIIKRKHSQLPEAQVEIIRELIDEEMRRIIKDLRKLHFAAGGSA